MPFWCQVWAGGMPQTCDHCWPHAGCLSSCCPSTAAQRTQGCVHSGGPKSGSPKSVFHLENLWLNCDQHSAALGLQQGQVGESPPWPVAPGAVHGAALLAATSAVGPLTTPLHLRSLGARRSSKHLAHVNPVHPLGHTVALASLTCPLYRRKKPQRG